MKKVVALLVLALAATALVACGDDDSDPTTGTTTEEAGSETAGGAATGGAATNGGDPGAAPDDSESSSSSTVAIEADPDGGLSYTTSEASTKAGDVTINFTNPQPSQHDVVVEGDSGDLGGTELISEGSDSVDLKDLKPGSYTFYCSVPGHREGGMEGTLSVE
jgi:plastocyanin